MFVSDYHFWLAIIGALSSVTAVMTFVNNWYNRHNKKRLDDMTAYLKNIFLTKEAFGKHRAWDIRQHAHIENRIDRLWLSVFMKPSPKIPDELDESLDEDPKEEKLPE